MKFDAVLFDCDGVLVDSEPITNGVLREMLAELGWVMTPLQCMTAFVGRAVIDEVDTIERHTGVRVDAQWMTKFRARRDIALTARLTAVPHIELAVAAAHAATGGRIACASGADRGKVVLQLTKVGLHPWFDGRIFSGYEMARTKPAPDVYLAAAAALGVEPKRCAVIEDTTTGARAGVAAGCTVFGYVSSHALPGTEQALMKEGVSETFSSMQTLQDLIRSWD